VKHTETNGKVIYRYFYGSTPFGGDPSALDPIAGAKYTVQIRADKSGSASSLASYQLDIAFQ
jgi:hypothetical protein